VPLPVVGITVGDPAGIGPEIAAKAAVDPRVTAVCAPRLYGPAAAEARARFAPGQLSGAAGHAAYDAIVAAVADAQAGRIDAIATAPVNKAAFALAGLPWKGHTDLLGHLTGAPRAVMFFHAERLKVALATVHIAIADVARALTPELLASTITITAAGDHFTFFRDGVRVGEFTDSTLTRGRIVLGVLQVASGATPPFEVLFKSVEILTPAGV